MRLIDSPEGQLLLWCARPSDDLPLNETLNHHLFHGGINWSLFTRLAVRHRVIPVVYRKLNRIAPHVLQEPALQEFMREFRASALNNLRLARELIRIIDLMESHGIQVMSFKGPLLAIEAFGDLSHRAFGDLDLLLRQHDLAKARKLMESYGYEPELKLDQVKEIGYMRTEHAFQYRRNSDSLVVELHWRLEDLYLCFPFDVNQLWNRSRVVTVFGRPMRTLSSEDLVLYLCMHGAKHYWERLEWICCLPAVIRASPGLQWNSIIQQARKLGGMRILQLGLLLASKLDPSAYIQAPLLLLKPDPIARDLAASAWDNLSQYELDSTAQREVYRFRFYLKARERLWDRLSVVRFSTIRIPHPNSTVWESVPLPKSLLFFHYFLTPLRRLKRYGLQGLTGVLNPSRIPVLAHDEVGKSAVQGPRALIG